MEGWYYRLTLEDVSFAFIISIEDPVGISKKSDLRLSCIQVVGPDDEYLVQADRDDTIFWAWEKQQGLGCTFAFNSDVDAVESEMATAMSKDDWCEKVESGFQIMPDHLLGRVNGHDGTKGGAVPYTHLRAHETGSKLVCRPLLEKKNFRYDH